MNKPTFDFPRHFEILQILASQPYTPAASLAEWFQITERTCRNDIKQMNERLEPFQLQIELKRKFGYYLTPKDSPLIQALLNETTTLSTTQDRIQATLLTLLQATTYQSIDDLADQSYVSRITMQSYLKTINDILKPYHLYLSSKKMEGVRIYGNESDKRRCFIEHLIAKHAIDFPVDFSRSEQMLFEPVNLPELNQAVISLFSKHKILQNDYSRKNIVLHIALMILRLQKDFLIAPEHLNIPSQVKDSLDKMAMWIKNNYQLELPLGEYEYMYKHIAANLGLHDVDKTNQLVSKFVKDLCQKIYEIYSFDIRHDAILIKDLSIHMGSILMPDGLYYLKRNPLLNTIKTNYPLAFEVTLTCVREVLPKEISEDEIGYIALHIGAAIERQFSGSVERKRIYIICGSGMAMARMLEARLNAYFQNQILVKAVLSYEEFKQLDKSDCEEVDFAVSTVPIQTSLLPIEVVDLALPRQDLEKLTRLINQNKQGGPSTLARFFTPDLFFTVSEETTKEALLEMMTTRMGKSGLVDDSFLASVLEREALSKTNLTSLFAIPHSMKPIAKQTKVAVAILKHPIHWALNADEVQIVFLLGIKSGIQKDLEHLYDLFMNIISSQKVQTQLSQCTDFNTFIEILEKTS